MVYNLKQYQNKIDDKFMYNLSIQDLGHKVNLLQKKIFVHRLLAWLVIVHSSILKIVIKNGTHANDSNPTYKAAVNNYYSNCKCTIFVNFLFVQVVCRMVVIDITSIMLYF